MKKIRTLIVDDEPLARLRILKLLENIDYVKIIGECKNGREALKSISDYKPDLVFLDIQMPDFNGFDVLNSGKLDKVPFVIFVTAYDHYALQAFDVKAVDYLLKPFDDERFFQALDHAKSQILLKESSMLQQKLVNLLDEFRFHQGEEVSAVEIKDKGRTILLPFEDLYYIEADGNYLRLYNEKRLFLLRETLQNLENQIDKKIFIRIHRSKIVNTNFVERISYKGNNQYQFLLKNGKKVISSRGYRNEIVKYLEELELKEKMG